MYACLIAAFYYNSVTDINSFSFNNPTYMSAYLSESNKGGIYHLKMNLQLQPPCLAMSIKNLASGHRYTI